MTQKTILDTFNAKHEKILSEKDIGVRLLKLNEFKEEIAKAVEKPKNKDGITQVVAANITAGVAAGASMGHHLMLHPERDVVLGGVVGGLIGICGGLLTTLGCVIGGVDKKLGDYQHGNKLTPYLKNVMPYIDDLKSLERAMEKERDALMTPEVVGQLLNSKKLKTLLKTYPDLLEAFEAARVKDGKAFKEMVTGTAPQPPKESAGLQL